MAIADKTLAREPLLRQGLRLEYFTVGWNLIEAAVSIIAGLLAGSIALVGFGLDSIIEALSGGILGWRLGKELREGRAQESQMERRAILVVGITFWLLSGYILYESMRKLWLQEKPEESVLGVLVLVVSLMIMPLLGRAKRQLARKLESKALLADAKETLVCAFLSATALLGVGLNALLGWWWADPVAGLLMIPWIAREGWEAVQESRA